MFFHKTSVKCNYPNVIYKQESGFQPMTSRNYLKFCKCWCNFACVPHVYEDNSNYNLIASQLKFH